MSEKNTLPVVFADALGHIRPDLLDRYISAWIQDNLEEALFKVLLRRGGLDLSFNFQGKLTEAWDSKHNVGIIRTELKEGARVRYSEDTPEYVLKVRSEGYIKGDVAVWEMVQE